MLLKIFNKYAEIENRFLTYSEQLLILFFTGKVGNTSTGGHPPLITMNLQPRRLLQKNVRPFAFFQLRKDMIIGWSQIWSNSNPKSRTSHHNMRGFVLQNQNAIRQVFHCISFSRSNQ